MDTIICDGGSCDIDRSIDYLHSTNKIGDLSETLRLLLECLKLVSLLHSKGDGRGKGRLTDRGSVDIGVIAYLACCLQ